MIQLYLVALSNRFALLLKPTIYFVGRFFLSRRPLPVLEVLLFLLRPASGCLDERALFVGQWGLKGSKNSYEEMVINEGRPRLRALINEAQSQGWLNAAVVYGYFPCYSDGNDLVILHHDESSFGTERLRFSFPRQRRDRRLCISDFFRSKDSGQIDVVAFHVVTMGQSVSEATSHLFEAKLS